MKIIFKFILALLLFFTTLYAENINECKTDIYFGNGVWNGVDDTKKSIKKLQEFIDEKIIKNDLKLKAKYGGVKLQYNWSHGSMIDVLETFYQLKEAGQISEEWFFTFVDELMAKQISDITDEDVKSLREQIINMIISVEENEVDKMLVKYYDESLKYGHRVLLVSHSQGNLFANRVHEKINPTEYKNYFANLQVASPASEVKTQKGDYVTGFVDPIINPIPGSMSSNADLDFPGGHKFVEAYLASEDTLKKITDKMKLLLADLDAEASQYGTDKEISKDTKNYKITVEHKFDPNIITMQDIEVYPFALSKKLYYVDGNISGYVKASCGGTKILDDWTDKKNTEFYMINNLEEEKIAGYTPILSGGNNSCKGEDVYITIENYNIDAIYKINTSDGSATISGDTIIWTIPLRAGTYRLSVTIEGAHKDNTAIHNTTVDGYKSTTIVMMPNYEDCCWVPSSGGSATAIIANYDSSMSYSLDFSNIGKTPVPINAEIIGNTIKLEAGEIPKKYHNGNYVYQDSGAYPIYVISSDSCGNTVSGTIQFWWLANPY